MTTTDVTTFTDKEAFVWLGFRRDTSLDFRLTLPYDKQEAKRVIEAVDCYNRFQPDEAWGIIDGWWEVMMAVDLAREGSVALYFRFPWTERQYLSHRETSKNLPFSWAQTRVPAEKCVDWATTLTSDLLDAGADEISYDRETRTLRAWWD